MSADTPPKSPKPGWRVHRGLRIVIAVLLLAVVLAYSVGVVSGVIAESRKIDAVHFTLIVATVLVASILVQPELLERFKRFKLSGFELEMLEKVQEKQAEQDGQLEDIRLMLPLLLPETERRHLLALDRGKTSGYRGTNALRAELRRLRSIGLLRTKRYKPVGDMKDDLVFDLADSVELTSLGKRWVRRIKEIEKVEMSQANEPINTQGA